MWFIIILIIIPIFVVGLCFLISNRRYKDKVSKLTLDTDRSVCPDAIPTEIDRIGKLQKNLKELQNNIQQLQIPVPEKQEKEDTRDSSLSKLSKFYEKYNLAVVGTEQFLMSILPISQIGDSIEAIADVIPPDIGKSIFGETFKIIHNGIHPDSVSDFLHQFCEGASHLSHNSMMAMARAVEHKNYFSAAWVPIKSGFIEAVGGNDAIHHAATSLTDIGDQIANSTQVADSVMDLTNLTDIDLTGHLPIMTLTLSSVREIELLAKSKTNVLSAGKNIALDVVGSGLGASVGAQIGAGVGYLIAGLKGAVIGGIIGGVGGGMGGRLLTNKIKMRPLNKAIKKYDTQYEIMMAQTERKSKETLTHIKVYAEGKKAQFKKSPILTTVPVDNVPITDIVMHIAVILCQFVYNELYEMENGMTKLRNSIWYSADKYDIIFEKYERRIDQLRKQLPDEKNIKQDSSKALQLLLSLQMPNNEGSQTYQNKIDECSKELKQMNDKNNSSILMWSYMINNLYQQTLNDIAEDTNKEMEALNKCFAEWNEQMHSLADKIKCHKERLGIE